MRRRVSALSGRQADGYSRRMGSLRDAYALAEKGKARSKDGFWKAWFSA